MDGIGIEKKENERVVEVWKKIENIEESESEEELRIEEVGREEGRKINVQDIKGEGVERLIQIIEKRIEGEIGQVDMVIQNLDMNIIEWI